MKTSGKIIISCLLIQIGFFVSMRCFGLGLNDPAEPLSSLAPVQQSEPDGGTKENLYLQLQNMVNGKITFLADCHDSGAYKLSNTSNLIAYLNHVQAGSQADTVKRTLKDLFATYKSLGGPEEFVSKVKPIASPCDGAEAEVNSLIDQQLAFQKSERIEVYPSRAVFGKCTKPDYPWLSLRNEEEGTVRVNILVNPDGAVTYVSKRKSSGFPLLDSAALAVPGKCDFAQSGFGGKFQPHWLVLDYVFKLPPASANH